MTVAQFAVLMSWVVVAATVGFALYWAIPMLSRVRFTTRVEQLRDEAVDMVLDGKLPAKDPAVKEFIIVLEAFGRSARHLTLARVAHYNAKFAAMGVSPTLQSSRDRLTPAQRKELKRLEEQLKVALARQLIWGSPLGYTSYALYALVQALRPSEPRRRDHLSLPRGDAIARETYVHVRQDVRAKAGRPDSQRNRELVAI